MNEGNVIHSYGGKILETPQSFLLSCFSDYVNMVFFNKILDFYGYYYRLRISTINLSSSVLKGYLSLDIFYYNLSSFLMFSAWGAVVSSSMHDNRLISFPFLYLRFFLRSLK